MRATTKRLACGAALVLGLSACGPVRQAPSSAPAPAQDGLVAGPSSSAYPIEGRNIRLVRSGERELALQLEVFNGTGRSISFGDLGLDYREQLISLVDPARGTAYGPVNGSTREGRISADTDIEPGSSATLTAVQGRALSLRT